MLCSEVADGTPDLAGMPGDVDDGIPHPIGHRCESIVVVSIHGDERRSVGRRRRPARGTRHGMTAAEGRRGDRAAEKGSATEDQNLHTGESTPCRGGGPGWFALG